MHRIAEDTAHVDDIFRPPILEEAMELGVIWQIKYLVLKKHQGPLYIVIS